MLKIRARITIALNIQIPNDLTPVRMRTDPLQPGPGEGDTEYGFRELCSSALSEASKAVLINRAHQALFIVHDAAADQRGQR